MVYKIVHKKSSRNPNKFFPDPPFCTPSFVSYSYTGNGTARILSLKLILWRYVMKHAKVIVMVALVGLASIGSVSAGHGKGWDRWGYPTVPAQTVTVSGRLQLINGGIAVVQGSNTYYTQGLKGLAGFIPGLQEGAQVTLEGYSALIPYTTNVYRFKVTKLTLNGKEYANLNMKW
jgi:hypothetical protein